MSRFYEFRKRHATAILFSTIAGLMLFAWWNRFIQDDAFISFRYADNLVRGLGLVWNVGERVEGYTNFLWMMLMSLVLYLGGNPVVWSAVLGLAGFGGSLILTHRIALHLFQSDDISLLAIILLGTNYTFSAYATGGLETSFQAMLYLAVTYVVILILMRRQCRIRDALALSGLLTLCVLLRLDSAILCVVVFVFALFTILKRSVTTGSTMRCTLSLVGPFTVAVGAWFAWKLSYYGDILPNTFYLKVSAVQSLTRGISYFDRYLSTYLFYPVAIISVFSLRVFFRNVRHELLFILLTSLAWIAYVVKVGGDFMEFRFIVPIIPMLVILFMWLLFWFLKSQIVRAGLILLVLLGSVHHVLTFTYDPADGIEPIHQLQRHVLARDEHWSAIGKVLGKAFDYDPRVSIATTAAGAIPFYSRLTTVDMLGLNDKYVARFGYYFGRAAGHERIATLDYLKERGVNLIVSHPYVITLSEPMAKVPLIPGITRNALPQSKAVEVPIDEIYKAVILYLTPSPYVDSVITRERWKVHQIMGG